MDFCRLALAVSCLVITSYSLEVLAALPWQTLELDSLRLSVLSVVQPGRTVFKGGLGVP